MAFDAEDRRSIDGIAPTADGDLDNMNDRMQIDGLARRDIQKRNRRLLLMGVGS